MSKGQGESRPACSLDTSSDGKAVSASATPVLEAWQEDYPLKQGSVLPPEASHL